MTSLTQRFHEANKAKKTDDTGSSPKTPCALELKKPCCLGKGFRFDNHGIFAGASVCTCILECELCLGHGQKINREGKMSSCVNPPPKKVVNLFNGARIPSRYGEAQFGSFNNLSGNGREVVHFLQNWVTNFKPKGNKGFVITGPVGVGKTYLLASTIKSLTLRGFSCAFVDFFQLLAQLRLGYASDQSDASVIQPLLAADVLVIDELGKGRNTEWELTILDQLVMGRYNDNKTIIASTNYTLGEEAPHLSHMPLDQDPQSAGGFNASHFTTLSRRVGSRIYSRLKEMCHFIELKGHDYRDIVSKT